MTKRKPLQILTAEELERKLRDRAERIEARKRKAAKKLARADKMNRAVELKLTGMTDKQVAETMGFKARSTATKLYDRALREKIKESAGKLQKQHDMRLDMALRAAVRILNGKNTSDKDRLGAIDALVRIEESRAKVLGYAAPSQHRIGGATNAPPLQVTTTLSFSDMAGMTEAELAELRETILRSERALAGAAAAAAAGPGVGATPPSGNDGSGAS